MISRTTKRFRSALQALPQSVRRQAREAYRLFRDNPRHPSLSFKMVQAPAIFSARIGLHYRALAVRSGEEVVWFWIGTHADYDRLLSQKL